MVKNVIKTDNAPAAIGPYSQGIHVGNLVFLSGQIGLIPESGQMAGGGVEGETHQAFNNIKGVLNETGLETSAIVKVTVFLKDITNFKKINEIYGQYFTEPFPARAAVAVSALPLDAEIMIDVIAVG